MVVLEKYDEFPKKYDISNFFTVNAVPEGCIFEVGLGTFKGTNEA